MENKEVLDLIEERKELSKKIVLLEKELLETRREAFKVSTKIQKIINKQGE